MERSLVFEHINHEREYQEHRWNTGLRDGDKPDSEKDIAEWLIYLEAYLNIAKSNVYHLNREEAKASLRKIAAIAVAALEVHGCPPRMFNVADPTPSPAA